MSAHADMPTTGKPPRVRHILSITQEHAEELDFLWSQRRAAFTDTRHTMVTFRQLNARIEAHIAGLLAVPEAARSLLLARLPVATDRDEICTAAVGLLRLGERELAEQILEQFAVAERARLLGLRDGFCLAPLIVPALALQKLLNHSPSTVAVAAAEVLACHQLLDPLDRRFCALLNDSDPSVCEQAWRAAAGVDALNPCSGHPSSARPYRANLNRQDASLRATVLEAALWARCEWVLPEIRRLASEGDSTAALPLLAAVGSPADSSQIVAAVMSLASPTDGPMILARYGHPCVLDTLHVWMQGNEVGLAVASGQAYTRITGADIRGARTTLPGSDDAGGFSCDFATLVWRPDVAAVIAHQRTHGEKLRRGHRWNRGIDLSCVSTIAEVEMLDLPSSRDFCLQLTAVGGRIGASSQIARAPHMRAMYPCAQ